MQLRFMLQAKKHAAKIFSGGALSHHLIRHILTPLPTFLDVNLSPLHMPNDLAACAGFDWLAFGSSLKNMLSPTFISQKLYLARKPSTGIPFSIFAIFLLPHFV